MVVGHCDECGTFDRPRSEIGDAEETPVLRCPDCGKIDYVRGIHRTHKYE